MHTTISIVIPLYNKADKIVRALKSALNQSSPADEIIVVNDGSTDQSVDIVNEFIEASGTVLIKVVEQQNAGVSAARNTGINAAKSDYVSLLDADDAYQNGFIKEVRSLISRYPMANTFCTQYRFVESNAEQRKANWYGQKKLPDHGLMHDFFNMAANGDLPITSSSVCIKKQALEDLGGFPLGQQMGEDQWVWARLAISGCIAYSSKVLSNYYQDSAESLMANTPPKTVLPYFVMLNDYLNQSDLSIEQRRDIAAYLRTHVFDLIRRNALTGRIDIARKLLKEPVLSSCSPRWIKWWLLCVAFKWRRIFLSS